MPDPVAITQKDVQEATQAVAALRQEMKENWPDKDKVDAINTFLDKQEDKNQAFLTDSKSRDDREAEMKERLHSMELELARGTTSHVKNMKDTEGYKAMHVLVTKGDGPTGISVEEKANLRTDVDTLGGYLAPSEMDNVITKKITEISAIRSVARVRTISAKNLQMAIRNTIPSATYEGEGEEGADSTSTYDNEIVTPFRQTFTTPITADMLMDGAFDMESEIMSDAGEAFGQGEGAGFVSGTGFKQPEGFLVNATVVAAARDSSTSGTVEAADVILLTGDLKTGYAPVYVMNRSTLAFLRTLAATTGKFLWEPGMNGPVANTLNGFPYLIAQDMPDIASDSLSIAFGDFRRGYTIIDRTGLSVVRDEFTLKKKAIVEFTLSRWNTGQVTLPEAIKLLKTLT